MLALLCGVSEEDCSLCSDAAQIIFMQKVSSNEVKCLLKTDKGTVVETKQADGFLPERQKQRLNMTTRGRHLLVWNLVLNIYVVKWSFLGLVLVVTNNISLWIVQIQN